MCESSQLGRARAFLASPRMILVAAGLAIILTLPSLRVGWVLDDYFHQLMLSRPDLLDGQDRAAGDSFRFMDGDPQRTQRLMDLGVVPWWTWPGIRAAFWRPVTAATHWLDYRLWPDSPARMHAQSIAWYGLLAAAVAILYRRIMGPVWIAGLAAVLYAVDDAHGMPVGWLANRNGVLAAFFGVAALIAHDYWRRAGPAWAGVVPVGLLAVSVLSAEAGIATCAYLFAYAVFIDRGTWKRRLVSLAPYVLVVIIWRVAWTLQGYGTQGLGLYTDPLREPAQYLNAVIQKVPLLIVGQWALPPPEVAVVIPTESVRWLWLGALVVTAGLVFLLAPVVRRSAVGRFWACGMLLSLLPVSATLPSDRLLFFVGIGAMALLAMFLQSALSAGTPRWKHTAAGLLILIHLIIAPVALAVRAGLPAGPSRMVDALHVRVPFDESLSEQTLVIVNAPSTMHAHYLAIMNPLAGRPTPKHTRVLSPAVPSVRIRRVDEYSLRVRPGRGYLNFPLDKLFRDAHHPLAVGERVKLAGMTVEVTELTADNRPAEALFRFDVPLDDPSLRWLSYKQREFVPFQPPPVGEAIILRVQWPW